MFVKDNDDLIKDEITKNSLATRMEVLAEKIWKILSDRKNESVDRKNEILESGWLESEIETLAKINHVFMQKELNKLIEICLMISNLIDLQTLGTYCENVEYILLPYPEEKLNLKASNPLQKFLKMIDDAKNMAPQVYNYIQSTKRLKRSTIPDTQEILPCHNSKLVAIVEREVELFILRIEKIGESLYQSLKQILLFSRLFYDRMEQWIVIGVKRDNDITYEILKKLRAAVNSGVQTSIDSKWLEPISNILQPYYNFVEGKLEFPFVEDIDSKEEMSIFQLHEVVLELRSMAKFNGGISFEFLKQVFILKEKYPNLCQWPNSIMTLGLGGLEQIFIALQDEFNEVNYKDFGVFWVLFELDGFTEQIGEVIYNGKRPMSFEEYRNIVLVWELEPSWDYRYQILFSLLQVNQEIKLSKIWSFLLLTQKLSEFQFSSIINRNIIPQVIEEVPQPEEIDQDEMGKLENEDQLSRDLEKISEFK